MDTYNKKIIKAIVPDDKVTKGGSITPTAPSAFIDVPKPLQGVPKANNQNKPSNK